MAGQLALPDLLAGLGVDGDQVAVDVGEEDLALVVDGRGHVGRRARVLRVGDPFPEDLAIAQPHRFGVAVLVDDVGDAVGDRGRELDQRVRVDRPGFAQRRVERAPRRRAGSACARARGRTSGQETRPASLEAMLARRRRSRSHRSRRARACPPRRQHEDAASSEIASPSTSCIDAGAANLSAAAGRIARNGTEGSGGRESNPHHRLGRARLYR